MELRYRYYISEMTSSGAVPSVVQPYTIRRRRFPSLLSGVVDRMGKVVKSLSRKFSKPVKKKRRRGGQAILRGIM